MIYSYFIWLVIISYKLLESHLLSLTIWENPRLEIQSEFDNFDARFVNKKINCYNKKWSWFVVLSNFRWELDMCSSKWLYLVNFQVIYWWKNILLCYIGIFGKHSCMYVQHILHTSKKVENRYWKKAKAFSQR